MSQFPDPKKSSSIIKDVNITTRPAPEPGLTGGNLTEPPIPGVGLGKSDLDPLGRGGIGTGMLADPRGFQRPTVQPPNLPDGARFDPFGPIAPASGTPPNERDFFDSAGNPKF